MVFKMCCVKIFMTLFLTFSTPQVYTPRLTNCLSIKPANLDKVQLDLDEKSHQNVAFLQSLACSGAGPPFQDPEVKYF